MLIPSYALTSCSIGPQKALVCHVSHGNSSVTPLGSANVLQAKVEMLMQVSNSGVMETTPVVLLSTADRHLTILRLSSVSDADAMQVVATVDADSPVLSFVALQQRFIVYTTISGLITVYDAIDHKIISKRKDHAKYGVQIISAPSPIHDRKSLNSIFLATAGWDRKILLYLLQTDREIIELEEPIASIELTSLPESILFKVDERDNTLYIVCSRRDSTFLYYYRVCGNDAETYQLELAGKQNLAPHANSWNAFSPSCLSACPTDPTLIAVATSSMPSMKALVVRLLFPAIAQPSLVGASSPSSTSLARTEVATTTGSADAVSIQQAREDAAVLFHCNTLVGQTLYSLPVVAWRPDGCGIWVNSEDGIIKGIDMSGKIVCQLRGGHDAGIKIRSLWAGNLTDGSERRECLLSGGFDGRLVLWTTPD